MTLEQLFPYIDYVSNMVSVGIGVVLGGIIFGGFMYGFKNSD